MAKQKAAPKRGRPPLPDGPRVQVLSIRGRADWKEWLDRGAKHCRTDVSKLVDIALIEYLQSKGFKEAPPER